METLKRFCFRKESASEKEKERESDDICLEPEPFSLPSPIPQWPKGGGFAKGSIQIGVLELIQISKFKKIRTIKQTTNSATFYEPIKIPDGFSIFGHYCQLNTKPLHGFILAVRETNSPKPGFTNPGFPNPGFPNPGFTKPALEKPVDYTHIYSSNVYFWVPVAPKGYNSLGILVTIKPDKPSLDEIVCVRSDLTEKCEIQNLILNFESEFRVWTTRPSNRGINGLGVPAGTFFCTFGEKNSLDELNSPFCLKNIDLNLNSMPNLDQIHALIQHYGPIIYFHPKETFLPSSVSWFFENGATLHKKGELNSSGESIDSNGSNLPKNGQNDGQFWMDLPNDKTKNYIKFGNLHSAELYCHIKPALSGLFTDIAFWIFCPFNGPGMVKIGTLDIPLGKVGQHVGDWEHFTLRINNFTGELFSIYYSQHSGGIWVATPELEFYSGNKAVIYSSKFGHASYPHKGVYLQGSDKLNVGIRNDAEKSDLILDSSEKYQIVSAEYLGDEVAEPDWLQYMREWGPLVVYNSRREIDRIIGYFPNKIRGNFEGVLSKLPCELYKEEGPTGPKEKNNWFGDERC